MPQITTNILNKTIYGAGLNQNTTPPDCLAVRLDGLAQGSYIEIYNIAWGIESSVAAADLATVSFGDLLLIRNEVFDPNFTYTHIAAQSKDVVFADCITQKEYFRQRDFVKPMELGDSLNWLVVMSAPRNTTTATAAYNCILTVRGKVFNKRDYDLTRGANEVVVGDSVKR